MDRAESTGSILSTAHRIFYWVCLKGTPLLLLLLLLPLLLLLNVTIHIVEGGSSLGNWRKRPIVLCKEQNTNHRIRFPISEKSLEAMQHKAGGYWFLSILHLANSLSSTCWLVTFVALTLGLRPITWNTAEDTEILIMCFFVCGHKDRGRKLIHTIQ